MRAKDFIEKLFRAWENGDSAPFFNALAPDLTWTAKGSTPISGTYHDKDEYLDKCYRPLQSIFAGPTTCRIRRIIAEGEEVAVEWHGETPLISGSIYAQDYCWLIRVNGDATAIHEVTGYFDTQLVEQILVKAQRT